MKKRFTGALFFGTLLCNVAVINAAPSYTFSDLSPDFSFGSANAINNLGQIAGFQSVDVPSAVVPGATVTSFTATLWDGGAIPGKYLTTPNLNLGSVAKDINDSGQIVGFTNDNFGNYTATLWENGQTKSLSFMGETFGMVQSINKSGEMIGLTGPDFGSRITHWDKNLIPTFEGNSIGYDYSLNESGQIAGVFEFSPMNYKAGIWTNGTLVDIGTLGASNDFPSDINDHGMVTGYGSTLSNNTRAFIYDGEAITALRMIPGYGGSTVANAINESGQVVGHSFSANNSQHATLWNGFEVYDLNDFLGANSKSAGWVLTNALDINDHGWIVGEMKNTISGEQHAFLLSSDNPIPPIPEPQTYYMLLAGLGLIGFMAYRRKETVI